MPTEDIVFPVSTFPGLRASEGAGRLINCYAEPIGEGGRNNAVRHRAPGLTNFGTTARSGCRGFIEVAGVLYVAYSGQLEKFTSSGGASTNVGTLNGTKKGFFARNNAGTPDKVFVDPDGNIYTFTPSATSSGFDSDLPSPNSVTDIDGYIVFSIGDGRAFATDLNAVTVNALSFGKAESKADGLTRVVRWSGRLLFCGPQSIELWTNQGLSPFPFARSEVIPRGIAGPYCITGFEDSFSKGVFVVADDNTVCQLNGYQLEKISTPDLDGLIEAVEDKTELEMSSYISRGHSFVEVSSETWTWVYNINNGKWHERKKYLGDRSRITNTYYSPTAAKWLCGDTETGNVQQITSTAYTEIDDPLVCEVWSAPVEKFPARVRVAAAWFDFAVGVGNASGSDPIATDPTVEISWSDDGGQTFSTPRQRKLGRQSRGLTRVRVNQCGATGSQGRIWKVTMSDPVHFGLMGGVMSTELRAA
jgi:hypothetical protein